jgi:acetyl esterase/lipase
MATGSRTPRREHHFLRWIRRGALSVIALFVAVLLIFNLDPRPGAALINYVFEDGAAEVKTKLEAHAPQGVVTVNDVPYREGDSDAKLDVYFPEAVQSTGEQLPTLVWTHGGAWISGYKDDAWPYLQLVAVEGYTVISLQYSLGPQHTYPTAIHQVNDALAYITAHAAELHVDPDRVVMAGDSAGAQITSQIAAIVTNPAFASEMGITPALRADQLRGTILYCGIYDMEVFLEKANFGAGILGWGTRTTVWAYTGHRGGDSKAAQQMSTINHVTADFPTTFITGGNGDELTSGQSKPLADKLESLGVEVEPIFYADDHEPSLPHEYQFNLDNEDGQTTFRQMMEFLERVTAP